MPLKIKPSHTYLCDICGAYVSTDKLEIAIHRKMHKHNREAPTGYSKTFKCGAAAHIHYTRLSRDRCVNRLAPLYVCYACVNIPHTICCDHPYCWECMQFLGLDLVYNFRYAEE